MNHLDADSNFQFLQQEFPLLANLTQSAEQYLHAEPVVALFKLRQFVEKMADLLFEMHRIPPPYPNDLQRRLQALKEEDILPGQTASLLFRIKNMGNRAVHENKGTAQEALSALSAAFHISKWWVESYGEQPYPRIAERQFSAPPRLDSRYNLQLLQKEYGQLEEAFVQYKTAHARIDAGDRSALKLKAIQAATHIRLSEAETREMIDEQLRAAGWEADTANLRFANGARPQKGRCLAIAEWRIGNKEADYALFIDSQLVGIVEAKRRQTDVISDLGQAKEYARLAAADQGAEPAGQWGEYKVPFLFSTNSRPYHPQLETKSGIWFLDVRRFNNHPKALRGWFSPADLRNMLEKDEDQANQRLAADPLDYLTDKAGLNLRYYQLEAIQAVEDQVLRHAHDDPRALVAMATGTGKTRTIIGLCYRLIKSKRFKRILFLVDRNILGTQAADAFNEVVIEGALPFGKLYDLKGLNEKIPALETKVHFATVQGMVKRILYPEEGQNPPPVGAYDCIIVDEAHRGYTLDKEMNEDEIDFKDLNDYVSKYKTVLEYFNAFRIGLTATPALHTSHIFGKPVYRYTYRQAVIDGYLIDHEPPFLIKTELNQQGIVWQKGEKPSLYDREQNRLIELDELEDELKIEVEGFNKMVITENFNRAVAGQLVQELDPTGREKTLIFAANDQHADLVVQFLKEAFENAGVELDDDAVMKITGKTYEASKQVTRFKNERIPNIVVTVDLLSTGVDVPEICNIVFLRRVKSRILYEQMLGRATRRADHIGKETFRIYDAVRLYEALEDVTDMRPVVVNPLATFEQLVEEIAQMDKEPSLQRQIEQIIAKLQQKKRVIAERAENVENFKRISGGFTPEQFIKALRGQSPREAAHTLRGQMELIYFLDKVRGIPRQQLVSHHVDTVQAVERGFGAYGKPEDFLLSFQKFIEENRNKIAALDIICNRPGELTRQSLKELQLILAERDYTPSHLQAAWRQAKNEDIAADIIAYIRTLAMGVHLETPQERIERAFKTLSASRPWSKVQLNWLERIKARLLDEVILDRDFFEKEPFKADGGYRRLNKIFQDELDMVIKTVNDNLFQQSA